MSRRYDAGVHLRGGTMTKRAGAYALAVVQVFAGTLASGQERFAIHFAGKTITPPAYVADQERGVSLLQLGVAHGASDRSPQVAAIAGAWSETSTTAQREQAPSAP